MSARIVIPLIPESVNHYTQHSKGRHFKNKRAQAFEAALPLYIRGQKVCGERFSVSLRFVLGPKQHPDVDNLPKQVLDGLAKAGVFINYKGTPLSDNKVKRLVVDVIENDRANCRTEITVEAIL
jgi:Holliday junction resolvase RusA-like endonuclease